MHSASGGGLCISRVARTRAFRPPVASMRRLHKDRQRVSLVASTDTYELVPGSASFATASV
eukprot:6859770-Pyramimonas_sp.AAC.1